MHYRRIALLACLSALSALSFASTELVVNGDFETPTPDGSWVTSNPDGDYLPTSFTGWTSTGAAGVWRPNVGMFSSMPSGVQAGYCGDGGSAGTLTQDLNYILGSGDSLVVSFSIGDRANLARTYGISTEGTAVLYGDASQIASFQYVAPGTLGNWATVTFFLSSAALTSHVGENLNIVLSSPGGKQASFDNVSVQVDSVPEPATMGLLSLGVAALARRKRRA